MKGLSIEEHKKLAKELHDAIDLLHKIKYKLYHTYGKSCEASKRMYTAARNLDIYVRGELDNCVCREYRDDPNVRFLYYEGHQPEEN